MVNLFIFCELDTCSRDLNTDFIVGDCFFVAVKLTKNSDLDKHGYNGFDMRFDLCSNFHCQLMNRVKMLLFFVCTIIRQSIPIIEKTVS